MINDIVVTAPECINILLAAGRGYNIHIYDQYQSRQLDEYPFSGLSFELFRGSNDSFEIYKTNIITYSQFIELDYTCDLPDYIKQFYIFKEDDVPKMESYSEYSKRVQFAFSGSSGKKVYCLKPFINSSSNGVRTLEERIEIMKSGEPNPVIEMHRFVVAFSKTLLNYGVKNIIVLPPYNDLDWDEMLSIYHEDIIDTPPEANWDPYTDEIRRMDKDSEGSWQVQDDVG
jgi:hypothetical protein